MIKKKMQWLYRLLSIDVLLGVICLGVLVLVTFVGAIMRYFFNSPLIWQEEVQTWMILWAIFSGASYVFRSGMHVAIEILVEKFSPKLQVAMEWFGFACTTAVLAFVCVNSVTLILQFYTMGKVTPMLRIPSYIIYAIVPFGCVWMVISYLLNMINKYYVPAGADVEGNDR